MPVKILIVDDEPDLELLIRQRFRKQIREGLYDFLFVRHGGEALDRLQADPSIGVILSDINMPVMDGLTLLARLAEAGLPATRAVVVSAYGDLHNIRTAMNRGAFDFLTKPIDFQDFEATMQKTIRHIDELKTAAADRERLLALQGEMKAAANIQLSILPRKFPPFPQRTDFNLHAVMYPARAVGGDFYDFFLLDRDRLGLVIGDVSGKGVPAALFMAVSRTLLRTAALHGDPPGKCLTTVNEQLLQTNEASLFVTLFYGILDTRTGDISYASGGHNPPYVVRAGGAVEELPGTGDTIVGILEGQEFSTHSFAVGRGDTLLLYTDGITEAMDPQGQLFGEARLRECLARCPHDSAEQLVQSVVDEVQRHAAGAHQSDDLTALALRFNGGVSS
jgi:sigma-B regulation protein RsbU (phosphoserine phosphatase)